MRQNLTFAAEAARLVMRFRAADIRFFFLKGVTLNILAYGTLGIKKGWDIDVAVDPGAYLLACGVMEEAGYDRIMPGPEIGPARLPAWLAASKHTIWMKPGTDIAVELHSAIVDNPMLLPSVSVASKQQEVEVSPGMLLPTLNKDELFAYLCVHGSAHGWSRLKWLTDIAALLMHQSEGEVERLYRRSIELGGGRTAAQALLLCADLLALPLSPKLKEELAADRAVSYLRRAAAKALVRSRGGVELDQLVLGTVSIQVAHFLMVPGWRYKASEFRRKFVATAGAAEDDALVTMWLSPLYRVPQWLLSRARKRRLPVKLPS